ncbi:MAG: PAS domain S-box protein, partial [Promethearchaeota archaeon]
MDIHRKEDLPYVIEQFEKLARNEMKTAQGIPFKRKDGHVFYADINSSSIIFSGKKCLVGIFRDITDRKQAEEALINAKEEIEAWNRELEKRVEEKTEELKNSQAQLIQSEKLSAMGQMAGGLAHELNSPLAGLLPILEKYKNEAEKDSKEYNELSLMHKACEHMAKIVRDFGSFSRESKGEYYELNLNEVIDDTLGFSASRIKQKGIQLIKEYKDTLPKVDGEKTELQQVILNM